jgi:hypothetical protein
MRIARTVLALILVIGFASMLDAQALRQGGMIRGVITDKGGEGLPGVAVTTSSPALIGKITDVSGEDGSYRLPSLPPGTYIVTAELSGFKMMKREGVVVRVGQVIAINFTTEPSAINEEIQVTATSPVVDVQSLKISTRVDSEALSKLPLGRQFANIIAVTPGIIEDFSSEKMTGMGTGEMHGGTAYSNAFEVDGVGVNDPAHNASILFTPQYDAIEEVDIETGGLSAAVGNTGGNFINVVTKSGGNTFHGTLNAYYHSEDLVQSLYQPEQLKAFGLGLPAAPIFNYNVSGSLGGPIIKDKLWFFSTLAIEKSRDRGTFIPTVIFGKQYNQYDVPNQFIDGFLKLTTQLSTKLRLFVMGGYSQQDRPIDGAATRGAIDTRYDKSNNIRMMGTANLSWQLGSNTILDFRTAVSRFNYPIYDNAEMKAGNGIGYSDGYTGYAWGYAQSWASDIHRTNFQTSARLTQYLENILGGNHEIGAGVEFVLGQENWGLFRSNPLNWDYYNGNPYYYRGLYNLTGPHPTYGDGQLMFQIYGPDMEGSRTKPSKSGISAYIQDNWTIKNRLTVSLGLRFDHTVGYIPAATHKAVTSALALGIGDYYFKSQYGFNPFAENSTPAWDNAMKWDSLSPRIGLTYDIFGNGKTAFKTSFAIYREAMPSMYYQGNHPFSQSQWGWNPLRFRWWDTNNNGTPDAPPYDAYQLYAGNISDYNPDPAVYTAKIDPNTKAPQYNEFIVGIEHELLPEFNVGIKYLYRERKNALDTVLYDKATGRPWYTLEKGAGWWVPYSTTIPAYGVYPAETLTVYFPSTSSPWTNRFNLFTNVEESVRKYNAVELTFEKRFSRGWSLGGSVVLSKTYGDNSGRAGSQHGFSGSYDNPNWFVNRLGLTDDDRPLAIKLYGAVALPYGFVTSFFVRSYSGFPYQRTITIYPPTGWAAVNNAIDTGGVGILAEPQGTRRSVPVTNVDGRLERSFSLGKAKNLIIGVDAYNLLGNSYVNPGVDPAGSWIPTLADPTLGKYTPSSNYGKVSSISAGVRLVKLNIKFTF